MSELLSPLIQADVDLRDFAFLPLDVLRLRDSELSATPDAEAFRCCVLSWCVSWHQLPAGSLPDDDATLARLLGFGRDLKGWKKARMEAVAKILVERRVEKVQGDLFRSMGLTTPK